MKRQRGRGRRPGGGHQQHNNHNNNGNPNRPMESNGPDNTKVRGPAAVVYERYQQYARDAYTSGDRVLSENYLQHADHYFRLMRTMQPVAPPPNERFDGDEDYSEFQGDEEGARAEAAPGDNARGGGQNEFDDQGLASEQPRGDGDFRRRRGRRTRFRPGGEGGDAEGAEARGPDDAAERPARVDRDRPEQGERPPRAERSDRAERPERRERAPRERDEPQTQEGFSNGPRPAFLRTD